MTCLGLYFPITHSPSPSNSLTHSLTHPHSRSLTRARTVVVLCRELLRAELVRLHDLARERPRLQVPAREEKYLANHRVVRYHHGHCAEERLEVVRQVGAAGVAWVHRDERVAHGLERQRRALELELFHLCRFCALDRQDLLRNHREHLEIDTVELVEARPRARRRQPLEELGHRQVVEAVRAVHDHGLARHRLAQVLGRLGLARTSRTLRRAAQIQLQRTHERTVAPVGQRRDDEPALQPNVLVAVGQPRRDHAHVEPLFALVVAQLREPVEVGVLGDAAVGHGHEHVARMHVHHDERRHHLAHQLGQVAAHELDDVVEVVGALLRICLQPLVPVSTQGLLDVLCPHLLRHGENDLALVLRDPHGPLGLGVGGIALAHDARHRLEHVVLDEQQPLLDHGGGRDFVAAKGNLLAFGGHHGGDGVSLALEGELADALEALAQMRLHARRLLCLGEDLEHLVVGEEEKA
eukprot:863782-Pleurochrysis_carterae.AAC.1